MKPPTPTDSVTFPEDHPGIIFVRVTDVIVPEELDQPMGVSLKLILQQLHDKTCAPIIVTPEIVLVDGIKQYKIAKKFGWTKIPAIIKGREELP